MKKRGKKFKGQVFGNVQQQSAQREAIRSEQTESIAQRIASFQPGVPLTTAQRQGLLIGARLALEAVRKGKASEDDIGWLVNAVNMALIITELGLGEEFAPQIRYAQDGLMRMLQRHERIRNYVLDGEAWKACVFALDVHEGQLESEDMTDKIMLRAIDIVKQRQARGDVLEARQLDEQPRPAPERKAA